MQTLHGQSDIRDFIRRNQMPIQYINTTVFNLLRADEWINSLSFINTIDSFDGQHPSVFVPSRLQARGPQSIEAANEHLLRHPAVADHLRRSGGSVLFLMFDPQIEALAQGLGLTVVCPPAALRQHLGHKVTTTRLADCAGIPSVPNVLAQVDSGLDI